MNQVHYHRTPIQKQEDFEDFFENSLCGYLTTDRDGLILRANSRMATWLGCSTNELKEKRLADILTIGGKIYYETHLGPLLRMQGFFEEVALELACLDGMKLPVFVNGYERRDEHDRPEFVRFTILKANERRKYEQNLREAKIIAEQNLARERQLSALREQFIAVLGHDLRNPVSAISGVVQLLLHSDLGEQNNRLLTMLLKSCGRVFELIENVMDFARARMGSGMAVDIQNNDILPALEHVVEELKTAWPDRDIQTEFDIVDNIACDPARISQLLSNLLGNALIHGANGLPVIVRATVEEGLFKLSVINGGKAISPMALEKLFEPFTREVERPSRNGLGLGLYICSEIARAHKGQLTVKSTDEETCFTFAMSSTVL